MPAGSVSPLSSLGNAFVCPCPCPTQGQAGAGTSLSPCLQVLLFLQDALNPLSHPDMCFNISAVSGGGRKQQSPESFPQVSLSYRSCLMGLASSLGCAGQMVVFLSMHLSGVPQPGSVLTCFLGKQAQPLAGDQRPSWDSWRAELSQDTSLVTPGPCGHRGQGASPPGSVFGTAKHQQLVLV